MEYEEENPTERKKVLKDVAIGSGIAEPILFVDWYMKAFPTFIGEASMPYFREWISRYRQGPFYFVQRMDEERREIFLEMVK